MATTVLLKPNATVSKDPGWNYVGPFNPHQVLSDDDDATYMQEAHNAVCQAVVKVDLTGVPSGKVLNRWRVKLRNSRPFSDVSAWAEAWLVDLDGQLDPAWFLAGSGAGGWGVRSLGWDSSGWYAGGGSASDILAPVSAFPPKFPAIHLADYTSFEYASFAKFVEAQIEAEFVTAPSCTVNAPSGTVTDTNYPTISWTFTSAEGFGQSKAYVRVYAQSVYSQPGFDVQTNTDYLWGVTILGAQNTVTVDKPLPISGTFRAYVHAYENTGYIQSGSNFTYAEFTMGLTGAPPAPTLTGSYDLPSNSVGLTVAGHTNLLTLEQSSLEAGTTVGWAVSANCAITNSTTQARFGTHSLRLSSSASGDMSATTLTGTNAVPVAAGQSYTAMASFRAGASARSCRVDIRWYDAAGAQLSTTTGAGSNDATGSWVDLTTTGTAPAGAVYAAVRVYVVGTGGASELHYVDRVGLAPGTGAWSLGGFTSPSVLIERSNDGGVTWVTVTRAATDALANGGAVVPATTQAYAVTDYEAARPGTVYYRAQVIHAFGTSLASSGYSSNLAVTTTSDGSVWLKAITDPTLNTALRVRRGSFDGPIVEDLGIFRALGRPGAIAVRGAIHGDDGDALTLMASTAAEYAKNLALARHQGVLLLQSVDLDENGRCRQWWISAADDRARHWEDNPKFKEIAFPYVDVGPG